MSVIAVPERAVAASGAVLKITLKIKNIGGRTCARDVGADAQELYIQQDTTRVWSSDRCDPLHGVDLRQFTPNVEAEFYVMWDGRPTSTGCGPERTGALPGAYQVVGRLVSKFSDPSPLRIT